MDAAVDGFEYYLRVERHASPNTVSNYIRDCRRFVAWAETVGLSRPSAVTAEHITDFFVQLDADGLGARSRARARTSLRQMFRFLIQEGQLSIDSLTMSQLLSNVNLSSAGQIAILDISQAQTIDNVTVTPAYSVDVNDLSVTQLLSNVTLSAEGSVAILDALQVQSIDNVELTATGTIQVDSLTTQQLISIVRFGGLVVGSLDGEVVIFTALDGNPIIYH